MSTVDGQSAPGGGSSSEPADLKLEAVVIPVADANRSDIEAAPVELASGGATVSGVFHSGAPGAQLDPEGTGDRVNGPDPDHKSYNSFATFEDPDGNSWLLQEVTDRLPGRLDPTTTSFNSAGDLAAALRRAESAHAEHEKRIGRADSDWPDWYAEYMVREQSGQELPA
jgi:hypothetical protein